MRRLFFKKRDTQRIFHARMEADRRQEMVNLTRVKDVEDSSITPKEPYRKWRSSDLIIMVVVWSLT